MVGAEVKEGDVLVGKVTPKAQAELSGEDRLLQVLFGNKSKNYKDTSLRVQHGADGVVSKVQRFTIANGDKLDDDTIELIKVFITQKRKVQIGDKLAGRHGNKGVTSIVVPVEDMPHLQDGTPIDVCLNPQGVPSRMNLGQIFETHIGLALRKIAMNKAIAFAYENDKKSMVEELGLSQERSLILIKVIKDYCKAEGHESAASAIKAMGNIDLSIILRKAGLTVEDINYKITTPVFSGAKIEDVRDCLVEAGYDIKENGKFTLIDGRTGEAYDNPITVGIMHIMKLDHMVEDKIHARAIGPYSRVTQQPLGGKSQNGGQRFGEMEV
jgi:DNA-directed RNA polymerase subunit beta